MKLQEEKAAEVRQRWNEIQNAKAKEAAKPTVPMSKPPVKDTRPALTSGVVREMANKIKDIANKRYDQLTPDEKKQVADTRKLSHDEDIADLKQPVEWFGKVAVGESKSFPGWWKVVPPVGFSISYQGKAAHNQAVAQAQIIREYYE